MSKYGSGACVPHAEECLSWVLDVSEGHLDGALPHRHDRVDVLLTFGNHTQTQREREKSQTSKDTERKGGLGREVLGVGHH